LGPNGGGLSVAYRGPYCKNVNDFAAWLRGAHYDPCGDGSCVPDYNAELAALLGFGTTVVAQCQDATPFTPLANPGLGYLDGAATYQVGGIVSIPRPPPCGALDVPTPLIPAGGDLGGLSKAPFGMPHVSQDTGCQQDAAFFPWKYTFTMAIDIGDAIYNGLLPFGFDSSEVAIHVAPKTLTETFTANSFTVKESCQAAETTQFVVAAQQLLVEANAYVKSQPWPTDGNIHYLQMSDGSWLMSFPGSGLGFLDYSASIGSQLVFVGTAKFSFDATWTVLQTCPSTVHVCAAGVAREHGANLITN
jgi:hypothetical protein